MRRLSFVWVFVVAAACRDEGAAKGPTDPQLFPTPRQMELDGSLARAESACVEGEAALPQAATLLAQTLFEMGISRASYAAECRWKISLALQDSGAREAYDLVSKVAGSVTETTITASDEAGARYALATMRETILAARDAGCEACVPVGRVNDAPSFAWRGIVEGFYGTPYTADERGRVMRHARLARMNRYLYGPKNDLYSAHRSWREPYPPAEAAAMRQAVADAEANGLRFIWAASPGRAAEFPNPAPPELGISYASEADLKVLLAKYDAMRALGVKEFGLFLDDINEELYWPLDKQVFGDLITAQRHLINAVQAYMRQHDPAARLLVVGTSYCGIRSDWQSYNTQLAAGLDPAVDLMWTGPDVFSLQLTPADLVGINAAVQRQVVIWDNWPREPGASYTGRATDLATATQGILANPVLSEWGAHPLNTFLDALGPIGDYMWNASAYAAPDSIARWRRLLERPETP